MPPFQLPAPLIHLIGICRPRLLRPDLRVPTIANVDFRGLRKDGFNAVVIDKDNCLTLPEKDYLYPPLQDAWSRLKAAFPPGRVLVVSNSAGTKKDPGAIAAEHVAVQLRCPVLLHAKPKPACSVDILKYFRGELGAPRTLQSEIKKSADVILKEEKADEQALVDKWLKEFDGPLRGPPQEVPKDYKDPFTKPNLDPAEKAALDAALNAAQSPPPTPPLPPTLAEPAPTATEDVSKPLRILVIGDRLFTDTLLAHRLRLHLGVKGPHSSEQVISIHTTQLPDPRDVRILRWIENRLSGGPLKLRETSTDWGRFIIREHDATTADAGLATSEARRSGGVLRSLREVPPLTWSPSSWKPLPLLFGLGRGVGLLLVLSGRTIVRGVLWAWSRATQRTVEAKEVVVEEIKQEQKLNAAP